MQQFQRNQHRQNRCGMPRQSSSCPGMQSPISNFTLSSPYPTSSLQAEVGKRAWPTLQLQNKPQERPRNSALRPLPHPQIPQRNTPPFTLDHWDFTRSASGLQCIEAYLPFQCSTFTSPREFQSTCSIYPRWKKPVLCHNRTAPQILLK